MPRERHTCTIPGCGGPCVSGGLCDKHRKRKARYGDPLATQRIVGDDEARWWSHVDRRGDDECWPWTAYIYEDGYGVFWDGKRGSLVRAPRWGYEHFVSPIPAGQMPDHLCRNRACCNWAHLEPVTNRENVLRGKRTKLSDETVMVLYALHRNGQPVAGLAQTTGIDKGTLYRRFRRLREADQR
jgi:HNH endonuclease